MNRLWIQDKKSGRLSYRSINKCRHSTATSRLVPRAWSTVMDIHIRSVQGYEAQLFVRPTLASHPVGE